MQKVNIFFFFLFFLSNQKISAEVNISAHYARKVNPFIGTDGQGYTYPGATLPWGMVSVSPHTTHTSRLDYLLGGVIAPSGYRYGQRKIKGFGQTHLSGVGCPALGAPLVSINVGERQFNDLDSQYSNESAIAGYYSVHLDRFNTKVELTATTRVGVHRFSFPKHETAHILINAYNNLSWANRDGYVEFISDTEVIGWSKVGNFCNKGDEQTVYFAAKVNKRPINYGTWKGLGIIDHKSPTRSGKVGAWFSFKDETETELYVGISYTSMQNALTNLYTEIDGENFDTILSKAIKIWDEQLGKIAIESAYKNHEIMFYTALYHSLLHPSIVSDANGDYLLYSSENIGNNPNRPRYSIFSLWDTYRNLHSFLSLVYPKQQQEMLLTLEDMTLEAGQAPQWELLGDEVNMMVGDPALSVLAEGFLKGFKFNNIDQLFQILYKGALTPSDKGRRPGNYTYQKLGFIPHKTKGVWGAVSTTLEYSYHDWSLAQLAKKMGNLTAYHALISQASGWHKLFDYQAKTLRPKDKKNRWLPNFDPTKEKGESIIKLGGPRFVEGNAYQYTFMIPHGISQLLELYGSESNFVEQLRYIFDNKQFAMWNEPDLFYPYLFNLVSNGSEQTNKEISEIRSTYFNTLPSGIPGNDDCGTLSTWYIFSALGFYPVNPVSGEYVLGLPLFPKITIFLDTSFYVGQSIQITMQNKELNAHSHHVFFNNEQIFQTISHDKLISGGELIFD